MLILFSRVVQWSFSGLKSMDTLNKANCWSLSSPILDNELLNKEINEQTKT